MKLLSYLAVGAGLTAIAALVAWQGFTEVTDGLVALGWGVALLPLAWLPHLALSGAACRLLFNAGRAPRLSRAMRAIWVGQAVNTLLPAAGVGDEIVKARMLTLGTGRGVDATAAVVLDKTVQALTLLVWGLIGLLILVSLQAGDEIVIPVLIGSALLALGIVGFVLVQRAGAFGFLAGRFGKWLERWNLHRLVSQAGEVDQIIAAFYRRPGRFALACAVRLLARFAMTAEILLAAYLMGHPISLMEAVMLRGLTTALRGIAFPVPNGLGVQEGGYILFGSFVGLSPEFMLALSLATRARELIVGVPGLAAWQHAEGRALSNTKSR